MMEGYVFGVYTWDELINWYLGLPAYGQLLCLLAAFALISFTIAIVYYVIKGVVYLLYYAFKGVFYLIAGIFFGLYWIFETIYCAISGNERPSKNWKLFSKKKLNAENVEEISKESPQKATPKKELNIEVSFCNECGSKFTDTMKQHLTTDGIAFCPHCGKGYKANSPEIVEYL